MFTPTPSYKKMFVFGREFTYREEVPERRLFLFLEKVDFDSDAATGCWRWRGGKEPKGYGVYVYGAGGKHVGAHKAAWLMLVGPVEDGLHLHHRTEEPINCIGPNCVNPAHLLPVTPRSHVLDYTPNNITTIRSTATHCSEGHELTDENVYVIPENKARRCRTCRREWERRQYKVKYSAEGRGDARTHCGNGHELTVENTYLYMGVKYCRACHADLTLRRYHEKRATNPATHCKKGHLRSEFGVLRKDGGYSCRGCLADNRTAMREKEDAAKVFVEGVRLCKNGHPMTPENTVAYLNRGVMYDFCKICKNQQARACYDARKAKYGKGA